MASIELSTLPGQPESSARPPRAASFVASLTSRKASTDEHWEQPRLSSSSRERIVVPEDEPQWMKGAKLVVLLSILTIAMLMVLLDTSIIATAVSASALCVLRRH